MPAPRDFERTIRDMGRRMTVLEQLIRKPLAGSGLEVVDTGQIAQTGSIVIPDNGLLEVDGGDVVMIDKAPSAAELFRVGVQENGDRGLTVRRSDGTVALEIRKVFTPDDAAQAMMLRDRDGRVIAGDATLSPAGFDAPHLQLTFTPTDYTSGALAQSTSSATFAPLHECRTFRQNPFLAPQLMVRCSDATTAAEVQFYDVIHAGYLGGFFGTPPVHTVTVPAGTTAFTLFELPSSIQLPGQMSDPMHLEIHARVTAGTGSVMVAPVRTVAGPSA